MLVRAAGCSAAAGRARAWLHNFHPTVHEREASAKAMRGMDSTPDGGYFTQGNPIDFRCPVFLERVELVGRAEQPAGA